MAELIVALDYPDPAPALAMAEKLKNDVRWFKAGLELFVASGPGLLERLRSLGREIRVFLDLKFYDIPNTASKAALAAAYAGADMLTVHCQGGERMCRAVMDALAGLKSRPYVMGVTSLTSFANGEMPGVDMPPGQFALFLARAAAAWGLDGVVCSGQEAAAIRSACPGLKLVCPGIRPAGKMASKGDQRRVMMPGQAILAGADYLVVGRPITASQDPGEAAVAILEEMKSQNKHQEG